MKKNKWPQVKLGEISEINPSTREKLLYNKETKVTFVPMAAVDADLGEIVNAEIKSLEEVCKGYTYFENNDILFAKITPCMQNGKHAIAKKLINGIGFGSTEFHIIRPSEYVLPEWIHYFIRQQNYLLDAENHMKGAAGQKRLPDEYLFDSVIPLPPFDEQKRIAEIIEIKLKFIEKIKIVAHEQLSYIEALPSSILRQAFVEGL